MNIAKEYLKKIKATCAANDIELLVVLLPPKVDVDEGVREQIQKDSGWTKGEMAVIETLKNSLITSLKKMNIATLDLQSDFQASTENLYWHADHHLNVDGHALASKVLFGNYNWESIVD